MSVVVIRDGVMAADRLASSLCGPSYYADKLFSGPDYCLGATGCAVATDLLRRWVHEAFTDQAAESTIEEWLCAADLKDHRLDDSTGLLVVRNNLQVYIINDGVPQKTYPLYENCYSIGSGRHVAMAAMMAGAGADQAVQITAEVDASVGGPVDVCEFRSMWQEGGSAEAPVFQISERWR